MLVSTLVAGLTAFGDGIVFHILWALASSAGAVGRDRASLERAVTIITIFSVTKQPLQAYFAGPNALWRARVHGLALAVTGVCGVPLGAAALRYSDVRALKVGAGALFLLYAAWKLAADAVAGARRAAQLASADGGGSGATATPDGVGAPAGSPAAATKAGVGSSSARPRPPGPSPPPAAAASPPAAAVCRLAVPSLSPADAGYSPRSELALLALAGGAAGALGGALGVGGPPQMVAFAALSLGKDDVRAVATVFSAAELVARVAALGRDGLAAVPPAAAAATAGAAVLGTLAGTAARRLVDSAALLRALLVLVALSSGVLLGALDDAALLAALLGGVAAAAAAAAALAARPAAALRVLDGLAGAVVVVLCGQRRRGG